MNLMIINPTLFSSTEGSRSLAHVGNLVEPSWFDEKWYSIPHVEWDEVVAMFPAAFRPDPQGEEEEQGTYVARVGGAILDAFAGMDAGTVDCMVVSDQEFLMLDYQARLAYPEAFDTGVAI